MTMAACSSADAVPVMAVVSLPSSSLPCTKARAALAFSIPKSLENNAASPKTGLSISNRSLSDMLVSASFTTSMPAACKASRVSLGMKRPCPSMANVLRKATPPSLPFLPALSSTCMAALVSSKLTLAAFAAIPHCSNATLVAGSSALPA